MASIAKLSLKLVSGNAMAEGRRVTHAPRMRVHRSRLVLAVLCVAVFLDSLDVSVMTVALPAIQRDLDVSATSAQWLISGYTVAYGGFLVLGGRVADLVGRRRVLILSLVVFTLATVAGGLASSESLLIASRVLTGLTAAFTAPAALSLITTSFAEGPERTRALGTFALAGAVGFSGGLVISGVLTSIDWRLIFWFPAPIAVAVVLAAPRTLPPDGRRAHRGAFDIGGAVTVTVGVLLLVLSIVEERLAVGVPAVVVLAAFVAIERRHPDPLVPPALIRTGHVLEANVVALLWAAAAIGWQFLTVQYLRGQLGYAPLHTGLAILPLGISVIVGGRVAGPLVQRFDLAPVAVTGLLCQGAGIFAFAFADQHTAYVLLLPALIAHGLGNGLAFTTFSVAATDRVPRSRQGAASGLVSA